MIDKGTAIDIIKATIKDYYKSWLQEKKRAQKFGKANYEANCDIEINRLEKEYPELKVGKKAINNSIKVDAIKEHKNEK